MMGPSRPTRVQQDLLERLARAKTSAPAIERAPRDGQIPLSFGQERLWFLSKYDPESFAYNCPEALRLEGALDVAALGRALNEIVRRHEALRTSFDAAGGDPVQRVAEPLRLDLPVLDLSATPDERRENEIQRVMRRETQAPFDLSRGPLVRARLLRVHPEAHVLLWISHHTVYDGWSFGVFVHELAALYRAFIEGRPSPLPELAVQYADFAHWERQEAESESTVAYWRRQLAGRLPVLDLPTDRPRPRSQSYGGARRVGRLPASMAQELKTLGRSENATLFMVLLAAFQTLLARYTGQVDICIGSPVANRLRPEFESLIGFFANMLVFRGDLADDPTFRTLVRRTRDVVLEGLAYQQMPFGRLVEVLQPPRDVSRSPVFQVAFALQNTPGSITDFGGLEASYVDVDAGSSRFDLTLAIKEAGQELVHRIEYNTDLFEDTTIARMERHLDTLLRSAIADPDRRISELSYLAPEEWHELIVVRNQTDAAVPDRCVHELIEEQAARTPLREAIVFGRRRITYATLMSRVDALARRLEALGVGRETPVAVCMRRSPEKVIALLSILKAGGMYVPIDHRSPPDRVAYMLSDAQVRFVVADRHTVVPSTGSDMEVVRLEANGGTVPSDGPWRPPMVQPEQLAYTIYTSGSTGLPKGVQVPHRALVNFLVAMREQPGFDADDTILAITTVAFDIAALEVYLPLMVGGRVVIASAEDVQSPKALMRLLRTSQANVVQATPTTWRMLIEHGWTGQTSLKVLCGGEALPRDLANALLSRATEVWNMYGPTETAVWSSIARVERGEAPISLGRPIANTRIYVLDRKLQPVATGVAGELCIGGLGLARGYLNKPDLTADRFVPDPFSREPGARIYRTGDLVRSLGDGGYQFLGRLDSQVKVRGFRIELEGVEATLLMHHAVRTAVVLARPDSTGTDRLVAYVVPRSARDFLDEIRALALQRLPAYSVPGAFVFLDSLPLTENAKLDRDALPEPAAQFDGEASFVPPRDDVEQGLAAIWSGLLRVGAVSIRDSFFEVGGHSLLALRLLSSIEQQFGRRLPASALFESPTIERLARLIRSPDVAESGSCVVALQPLGSEPVFFCVHGVTGDVMGYQALARLLAPTHPVYGIESPGEDEDLVSIEARAARYIEEVRKVQPSGPYHLGGHSFGGMVAFEMARQLEAGGEAVGLVALFDTRRGDFGDGMTRWGRLKAIVENARHLPRLSQRLRYLWAKGAAGLGRRLGRSRREPAGREQRCSHVRAAARSYVQRPYGGRVLLFRADQGLEAYRADRLDWKEIAQGGVDRVAVTGGHDEMLSRPYVDTVARTLRDRIRWH